MDEKILFSDFVVKINRKSKEQNRTMLITDKAVYNIKNYKVQRRILLMNLVSVTTSATSEEFVMHIPEEYDYRYKSAKKGEIISAIKQANAKVNVIISNESVLSEVALTKPQASQQTREQILRRTQALAAEAKSSDEDDRKEVENQGTGEITSHEMMKGQQQAVVPPFLCWVLILFSVTFFLTKWLCVYVDRFATEHRRFRAAEGVGARSIWQGDASEEEGRRQGLCHEDLEEAGHSVPQPGKGRGVVWVGG